MAAKCRFADRELDASMVVNECQALKVVARKSIPETSECLLLRVTACGEQYFNQSFFISLVFDRLLAKAFKIK